VTELIVCNPRRNALLKEGSKSDRIDARMFGRREIVIPRTPPSAKP